MTQTLLTSDQPAEDPSEDSGKKDLSPNAERLMDGVQSDREQKSGQAINGTSNTTTESTEFDEEEYQSAKETEWMRYLETVERPETSPNFVTQQKWIGVVEKVHPDEEKFEATLYDLNRPNVQEYAVFSFDQLSNEEDQKLIARGGEFYWSIGFYYFHPSTKRNASTLIFRRMPDWMEFEIRAGKQKAEVALQNIDFD